MKIQKRKRNIPILKIKKKIFLAVFVTNSRNDIQQYVALKDNTLFCKKKKNEYIYHFCSKKTFLKFL